MIAKALIAYRFDLADNEHETGEQTKAGQRCDNGKELFHSASYNSMYLCAPFIAEVERVMDNSTSCSSIIQPNLAV